MGNKFKVDFSEMEAFAKRLEAAGQDLHPVFEKALEDTSEAITPGIEQAMDGSQYNFDRTGRTRNSLLKNSSVEWEGDVARIPVGFDINDGGLASIFLMFGTPTIPPDRALYNSIFGSDVRKKAADVQKKVFLDYIRKAL